MVELPKAPPRLCGLALAGGRSQRLGRDKAAVLHAGVPLLERAVRVLGNVVAEVRVSIRPDQASDELRRRHALLHDLHEGIGPAAGILAAHAADRGAAWLVLACDMPWVTDADLAALIRARDPARAATAFRQPADGRPEPLCAIYEPATLARFQDLVDAGGNPSPRDWLAAAATVLVEAPRPGMLASINSPVDLERINERA